MDTFLIEVLEVLAEALQTEAKQKKEWGHMGNTYGRSESTKQLKAIAKMLEAIEECI